MNLEKTKPLYTCKSIIDEKSYSEMLSRIPEYYWARVKHSLLFSFGLLIILGFQNYDFMTAFTTTAFFQVIMMIVIKMVLPMNLSNLL